MTIRVSPDTVNGDYRPNRIRAEQSALQDFIPVNLNVWHYTLSVRPLNIAAFALPFERSCEGPGRHDSPCLTGMTALSWLPSASNVSTQALARVARHRSG